MIHEHLAEITALKTEIENLKDIRDSLNVKIKRLERKHVKLRK